MEKEAPHSVENSRVKGGPLGKIESMFAMPETMKEFTAELRRLNDNLEKFAPPLIEVLGDFREMTAPWFGFDDVTKKKKKKK